MGGGMSGGESGTEAVPMAPDYGNGAYCRRIRVIAGMGRVEGELEDDFHHFRAVLEHDGSRVTAARGEALRVPWTTCPGAIRKIERLIGVPLGRSLRAVGGYTDPRAQCTHLFDAACVAIVFACDRDRGERIYDIRVPDRVEARSRPTLDIDGQKALCWEISGNRILTPEPFAGQALRGGGFGRWAEQVLPAEEATAALVLQRALFISSGRRYDFDAIPRAAIFAEAVGGACHTFSPEHEAAALRVQGTVRDFTDGQHVPLDTRPEPIDPDSLLR